MDRLGHPIALCAGRIFVVPLLNVPAPSPCRSSNPLPSTPIGNVSSSAVVAAREPAQFFIAIDTANGVLGEAASGKEQSMEKSLAQPMAKARC
jgi:hypothetical protein